MWWYNILGYNEVSISYILRLDTITIGYILLTTKLVALKGEHYDPIITVKRTEWRKFIDYFGLSIDTDPSRLGKKIMDFPYWVYTKTLICKASYIKAPSGQIF